MKILTVIGARPQFIKAATVSLAIKNSGKCHEVLVHTGQHYDTNMSDIFFDELEIQSPHYHLGIGGGNHGFNTGRMLEAIEATLVKEKPNIVMVYGDTDSTLAGALAAVKLQIPVVHVEAGLRSYNMHMPEEINRRLTDHVSTLLLTPNSTAVNNLSKEGISEDKVCNVGDVMYDATLIFSEKAQIKSQILDELNIKPKAYVLATIHRKENTNDIQRLSNIFSGLSKINRRVILPLHPRTREYITKYGIALCNNIHVISPVGYLNMLMLEKNAELIITDSGGVQKEAFFHKVPCITLRDETEWTELVEMGWNKLASPSDETFISKVTAPFGPGKVLSSPYGDGKAAYLIVDKILGLNI